LLGFLFIHDQLAVLDVVAEWDHSAHPHPFSLRRRDLVPDPLTCHFPFELRKGQQDIEGQPAHRGCGVELLGDGDKTHAARIKSLDHLGEVGQTPRQPIYLVNDNRVDFSGVDVGAPFRLSVVSPLWCNLS